MLLNQRIAIVTGGSNGMGEAIVKKFASEGAIVVIADIHVDRAIQVANEINATGGTCKVFGKVDITDKNQVQYTVQETVKSFGRIDILINCAGGVLSGNGTSDNITMDDWNKVLDLNLNGTMNMILEVLPFMKAEGYGKIVNFTSMGAFNPYSTVLHYHAAKGAIESVTANLAFELAPQGIYVNSVAPGPIRTTFWDKLMPPGEERDRFMENLAEKEVPLGRMGTAEDIAGVALFLSSSLSDFVTGEKINVGGGMGNIISHNSTYLSSKENSIINK
ncbi:SDR family NAD(P)-dependent oxidoreductase [Lysinibacillus sp. SGAir0095]|uniref:SDR family NAD(P)-dependent oxidoreductase n=1 Tax=Lysinibacillus sp. SGAir0095 TaxID=2070463 RepID=UPI0010CD25AD|nr:SDR family oxidoreductase [Lysinibacillus sp. SGAir0095]QCR32133.1 3-oxoacyl-ACP reductase [Lysinibacillus sp. SGAir0095]